MKGARITCLAIASTLLCLLAASHSPPKVGAEDKNEYVGTDKCATCHSDMAKKWALTSHRATLFNKDVTRQGCEGCHGPGGKHIVSGGDTQWIVRFTKLTPNQITVACLKCHAQEDVTLWRMSMHSRGKVSCINCHDPHLEGAPAMLKSLETGKLQLETLLNAIQQAQLDANGAKPGSKDKEEADVKFEKLTAEKDQLQQALKGTETSYKRIAEPYLCYNCHKTQQVQVRIISHHPIPENKMTCSSCHNPHGGPKGMLRGESVGETCFKCHPEKLGPFTFGHPPVNDDCSICHNPHGSVVNNLLVQNEPFLCLKCHMSPHSSQLNSRAAFAARYPRCTSCHNQPHGSNENAHYVGK